MRSVPAIGYRKQSAAGRGCCAEGSGRVRLLEPTVLTGTRAEMKVNCQEIFAPVVTVEAYDEFEDALRQLNNSPYGLQAGIFTRDVKLLFNAYEELEVGGLMAGDVPTFRIDHMPYGGIKIRIGPRRFALCDRGDDRAEVAGDESAVIARLLRWRTKCFSILVHSSRKFRFSIRMTVHESRSYS